MPTFIITLDAGTTSERAILFDENGEIRGTSQREIEQFYPQAGWVEHNPEELWATQKFVVRDLLNQNNLSASAIAAIGITNQRETTIIWNRDTGKPIYNAIVWQDRRTAAYCDQLKAEGKEELVRSKTGLVLDAYFSGTKIKWLLDQVEGAREAAESGKLAFGTVDTWMLWRLTHGKVHATDVSNASRTLLFNIHTLQWDQELLTLFDIPESLLPEVRSSSEVYGHTVKEHFEGEIPIAGMAGDQQAATFGQMCIEPGMLKNTYGTGCFMVLNTGEQAIESKHKLLTTIAWKIGDTVHYALEGSIFIGGAVVQWLRDNLRFIDQAKDVENLAQTVEDNGGVYLVPAFVGLGAPHWDPYSTGTMVGLNRGTRQGHIARAAMESICMQSVDVLETMVKDSGLDPKELRVDGGAVGNNLLMQTQADLAGLTIVRPKVTETTALGAAYLAGLAVGYWDDPEKIKKQWQADRRFSPALPEKRVQEIKHNWHRAIERSKGWLKP